MKIKIISCSSERYWYRNSVGCEFTVMEDPDFKDKYQVLYGGFPSNSSIDKKDCIKVCDEEDTEKKIYFKVYQDIENINGSSYITTPEEFMINYKVIVKDTIENDDDLFPVIEIVRMTEKEVADLPEFIGY